MSEPLSRGDRELLTELGIVLRRADPVPEGVLTDARAAFELSFVATDWAWLAEVPEPAVRSGRRRLRFSDGTTSVEVELHRVPWRVSLIGLVTPAAGVEVRWPSGAVAVEPDETGLFRAEQLPRGPLRVVVRPSAEQTLATPWFRP